MLTTFNRWKGRGIEGTIFDFGFSKKFDIRHRDRQRSVLKAPSLKMIDLSPWGGGGGAYGAGGGPIWDKYVTS
jgi:hypothetical protein